VAVHHEFELRKNLLKTFEWPKQTCESYVKISRKHAFFAASDPDVDGIQQGEAVKPPRAMWQDALQNFSAESKLGNVAPEQHCEMRRRC